eukprot:5105050-Pyramimonas_sp.AAC.1
MRWGHVALELQSHRPGVIAIPKTTWRHSIWGHAELTTRGPARARTRHASPLDCPAMKTMVSWEANRPLSIERSTWIHMATFLL